MSTTEISQELLEVKLLELLLEGDHPVLVVLRQQASLARVRSREFSGVGFFTRFEIPDNVTLAEPPSFAGGNVNIQMDEVAFGAGCVLFVRNGRLDMLECYTNAGDPWPAHILLRSLSDAVPPLPR